MIFIQLDSCSVALFSIIILDSALFQSSTHLNGAYNARYLPVYVPIVTQTHSHHIPISGRVNQLSHDSIAAPGVSNPRPLGYVSCAVTSCAIDNKTDGKVQ